MTDAALRLQSLANEAGVSIYIHPLQRQDISNDKDVLRRDLRLQLIGRYAVLQRPPAVQKKLQASVGVALPGSNDEVDDSLLAAAFGSAVDYLVTEDKEVHRKASRATIKNRVLFLSEAISLLEALFDRLPGPPPAVRAVLAHELNSDDPIFDSFRDDYPAFDSWLERCKRDGRYCWIIDGHTSYDAVAIVKREDTAPAGVFGRTLKICSFKVSPGAGGRKYGELLLKTIFDYSQKNDYDSLFVTLFEKQVQLFELLKSFGFEQLSEQTKLGELMLGKPMKDLAASKLRGLDYDVRFGPYLIDWSQPTFIIPIQPHYHRMLFPEQDGLTLFAETQSFGNAIMKAYICNSRAKSLTPGSVIWFYRSGDVRGLMCCGVVDGWIRSDSADFVAQFVARRTVYSYREIQRLAARSALAITFRQTRLLGSPIRLRELMARGILNGAPQSIVRINSEGAQWLSNQS